jgi:hypothetical protein
MIIVTCAISECGCVILEIVLKTHNGISGRVNERGTNIFFDLKKAHMFKCKIYMYRI